MVAKKTPAKKTPPAPKKDVQTTKVPAKKAAAPVNRTDKAGSSGMGMTKSGVKAKAADASNKSLYSSSAKGLATFDRHSGKLVDMTIEEWNKNDSTGSKATKKAADVKKAVLAKYGMAPKKKK
jgi:hypothetical protein